MTIYEVPKDWKPKTKERLFEEYRTESLDKLIQRKEKEVEELKGVIEKNLGRIEDKIGRIDQRLRRLERVVMKHLDISSDPRWSFKMWYRNKYLKDERDERDSIK